MVNPVTGQPAAAALLNQQSRGNEASDSTTSAVRQIPSRPDRLRTASDDTVTLSGHRGAAATHAPLEPTEAGDFTASLAALMRGNGMQALTAQAHHLSSSSLGALL